MLKTSLYPVRILTGRAIAVDLNKDGSPDITVLHQSPAAKALNLNYSLKVHPSVGIARQDPDFFRFLPTISDATTIIVPGDGVATLPVIPGLPFGPNDPLASLMVLANAPSYASARAFQVQFRLKLERKALVGGICYGGYPYLPTSYLDTGESLSNFGLPREWRLTPVGSSADSRDSSLNAAFLDAEVSVTRQEVLSHSGVHFLSCEPTYTDTLILTLSDWPRFLRKTTLQPASVSFRYGFLVPYLFVFEHREGTRYRPKVDFGLLAATRVSATPSAAAFDPEFTLFRANRYFPFSASSLTNGDRHYTSPAGPTGPPGPPVPPGPPGLPGPPPPASLAASNFRECFISRSLSPNEGVTLYLEQAQEFDRCLSGMRLMPLFVPETSLTTDLESAEDALEELFPELDLDFDDLASRPRDELEAALRSIFKLPEGVNFSESIEARVWEIDPPEGVAPTQIALGSKYTVLLADWQVDTLAAIIQSFMPGVPFRQPSSAHFIAVELINRSPQASRIVLPRLEFVQSAHVAASARPSRAQQVRVLNFRLVGDNLAEDLSRLGSDGFNFAVEHWVAGERKSVLFRATSLFDLVHTGIARVHANSRRRASEFETAEYGKTINARMGDERQNFDQRFSENLSTAWRRAESGKEITWSGASGNGPQDHPNVHGESDFVSLSNQEVRSHVRHLYPDESEPEWNAAATFANGISVAFNGGNVAVAALTGQNSNLIVPTFRASPTHELVLNFERAWRGFSAGQLASLKVTGAMSIVQSPYCLTSISGVAVRDLLRGLSGGIAVAADVLNGGSFNLGQLGSTLTDLANVGGLGALLATLLLPASPTPSIIGAVLALNGLTVNVSAAPLGGGVTFGSAPGNLLPVVTQSAALGTQGTITRQATRSDYSFNQSLVTGGEEAESDAYHIRGLMKRQITRAEVPDDQRRVRGAEVVWQDRVTDVVSGMIPLNVILPALARKGAVRVTDESIRVRLGSGVGKTISADFWFDVLEEMVRDDH